MNTPSHQIRAPFLPHREVQKRVEEFRDRYIKNDHLPVDILHIVEFGLKMEIRPLKELRSKADQDALLIDANTIGVDADEFMEDRFQNRLRFSIAHEIGHLYLHNYLYVGRKFDAIEDWISFMENMSGKEFSFLEMQANEFSGRLLVPRKHLFEKLSNAVSKLSKAYGGINPKKITDGQLSYIADFISSDFGVSEDCIRRRIRNEELLKE